MTQISRDDVLHLAQLSGVQLNDAEIDDLAKDIDSIIGYIKKLEELDTNGVEPTYQVTDLKNVWRGDKVVESKVAREDLLALAPQQSNNAVKVPKVL